MFCSHIYFTELPVPVRRYLFGRLFVLFCGYFLEARVEYCVDISLLEIKLRKIELLLNKR